MGASLQQYIEHPAKYKILVAHTTGHVYCEGGGEGVIYISHSPFFCSLCPPFPTPLLPMFPTLLFPSFHPIIPRALPAHSICSTKDASNCILIRIPIPYLVPHILAIPIHHAFNLPSPPTFSATAQPTFPRHYESGQ